MGTLTRAFEDQRPGLHIPWRNLAHLLRIPPGVLVIVLGAPGAMKSMLALSWCLELDEPTRIISLDTDPRTQASRIIARGTGIPSAKILEDRPRWAPWLREQKLKLKVGIQPTSAIEVGEVIAADTEFWGKAPVLVVVDDVSKLKMDRDYSSYDGAFLELHRAAKKHNTVVMAIHHLHRGDSGARVKPIKLSDGKYCVLMDTPVLCADLTWRPAGHLVEGDEVVAFDESLKGTKEYRGGRYRTASITYAGVTHKKSSTIATNRGIVVSSNDHPWATRRGWVRTDEIRPGDEIRFLTEPWREEKTWTSGYLAAMFDGEGCLSLTDTRHDLSFAQKPGPEMDLVEGALKLRGYEVVIDPRPDSVRSLRINGGFTEKMRFLGSVRPRRLLRHSELRRLWEGRKIHSRYATVSVVRGVGIQQLASLTTSTGTFVANGFLAHNTGEYEAPIVLGLWRPQHNQLKVGILKNRFGPDDPEGRSPVDLYADPSTCDIRDSYTPGIAVGRDTDYDPIEEGLIRP